MYPTFFYCKKIFTINIYRIKLNNSINNNSPHKNSNSLSYHEEKAQ